jgi:selenocysteine lyase/cysteine desulfurase
MHRREFLLAGGLALSARSLSACVNQSPIAATPATGARGGVPATWDGVKAEFNLAPDLVHMAGFFLASHPRPVRDALEGYRRAIDANPFETVEKQSAHAEPAVRAAAAEYCAVKADDIALTDSTTMGLGLVYNGMRLRAGQEILSTTHDHIVTTLACKYAAAKTGATFRQTPLYAEPSAATAAAMVEALRKEIRPETRVVAVTWVHSGTGVKTPIKGMSEMLAQVNAGRAEGDRALLCVDGVHGFGIEAEGPQEIGCDVFVAGCHKWIFGPRGTGIVWATDAAWSAIDPIIPSFDMMWRAGPFERMPRAGLMTPGGFHSFEHRWALEAAFRFHLALGKARVAARIHDLNRAMKDELAKMPRVKVATPRGDEVSAGIACFTVDGLTPEQIVSRLRAKNVVATVTPRFYAPTYARLSAGLITLEADIDRALAAVRAIA